MSLPAAVDILPVKLRDGSPFLSSMMLPVILLWLSVAFLSSEVKALPDQCVRAPGFSYRFVQEIQIGDSDPFKVLCGYNLVPSPAFISVYKNFFLINEFNRTYEEYVAGFGEIGLGLNKFFIGLEHLHLLTNSAPHEVIIDSLSLKERCDHFVIGNRTEGYIVKSTGNCFGTPCLALKKGVKWSTFDRDEDGLPDHNVAQEMGFGWWHNSRQPDPFMKYKDLVIYIQRKETQEE